MLWELNVGDFYEYSLSINPQVQGQGGSEHKYKGVTDVLKHLYKEGGIRSIFRGTGATLIRDGPGSAAYAITSLPSSGSMLTYSQQILCGV